jgi:hypothetical protein
MSEAINETVPSARDKLREAKDKLGSIDPKLLCAFDASRVKAIEITGPPVEVGSAKGNMNLFNRDFTAFGSDIDTIPDQSGSIPIP